MGVMFDYFCANTDEAAAAAIDLPGGPGGPLPPRPMPVPEILERYGREGLNQLLKPKLRLSDEGFHVVSCKGFDPTVDLVEIEALLSGVPCDEPRARPQAGHVLAQREEGEQLVVTISEELRDTLAMAADQ